MKPPLGWESIDSALRKRFYLESFKAAVAFTNRLAQLPLNRHPDVVINDNIVVVVIQAGESATLEEQIQITLQVEKALEEIRDPDDPLLPLEEIKALLPTLTGWRLTERTLQKEFVFANFAQSIDFFNRIATVAFAANHTPDIVIADRIVLLVVSTRHLGGLTDSDIFLLRQIEDVAGKFDEGWGLRTH